MSRTSSKSSKHTNNSAPRVQASAPVQAPVSQKPQPKAQKKKKNACPVTRQEFRDEATPVLVNEVFNIPNVPTKVFSTGSYGWHFVGHANLNLGEVGVPCTVSISMQIEGSKGDKKFACPITQKQFEEGAKGLPLSTFGDLRLPVKEFSTGTLGWYLNIPLSLEVLDRNVNVRTQISIYISHSKELPLLEE